MNVKGLVLALGIFCIPLRTEMAYSQMEVELERPGDAVEVLEEQDAVVVSITSWTGIGAARLLTDDGQWPETVVLRLNLSNLESLGITNALIRTNTSLKSPRKVPYWKIGNKKEKPDGLLECEVSQTDDAIDVVIPKEFLTGDAGFIRVAWIDAFRN